MLCRNTLMTHSKLHTPTNQLNLFITTHPWMYCIASDLFFMPLNLFTLRSDWNKAHMVWHIVFKCVRCVSVRVRSVRSTSQWTEAITGTWLSFLLSLTSSFTPSSQPARTWSSCTWTTLEVSNGAASDVVYSAGSFNNASDWCSDDTKTTTPKLCRISLWGCSTLLQCSVLNLTPQTLVLGPSMCQITEELCSPSLWSAIFTQPQEVTRTSQPLLLSGASTWPASSQRVSNQTVEHSMYLNMHVLSLFCNPRCQNVVICLQSCLT